MSITCVVLRGSRRPGKGLARCPGTWLPLRALACACWRSSLPCCSIDNRFWISLSLILLTGTVQTSTILVVSWGRRGKREEEQGAKEWADSLAPRRECSTENAVQNKQIHTQTSRMKRKQKLFFCARRLIRCDGLGRWFVLLFSSDYCIFSLCFFFLWSRKKVICSLCWSLRWSFIQVLHKWWIIVA